MSMRLEDELQGILDFAVPNVVQEPRLTEGRPLYKARALNGTVVGDITVDRTTRLATSVARGGVGQVGVVEPEHRVVR